MQIINVSVSSVKLTGGTYAERCNLRLCWPVQISLIAFFSVIGKEHQDNLSVKGKLKGKFTCTTKSLLVAFLRVAAVCQT